MQIDKFSCQSVINELNGCKRLIYIFICLAHAVINSEPSSPLLAPKPSVGPMSAASPGHGLVVIPLKEHRNPYHLTLVPAIGIAVTGAAVLLLVVLILLIRRKNRELKGSESDSPNGTSWKSFPQPNRKSQEGLLLWSISNNFFKDLS